MASFQHIFTSCAIEYTEVTNSNRVGSSHTSEIFEIAMEYPAQQAFTISSNNDRRENPKKNVIDFLSLNGPVIDRSISRRLPLWGMRRRAFRGAFRVQQVDLCTLK